ncbi:DUF3592 domain-containing protein [Spirillospora sp. CA-294931]|uniref:DUF3592 domain-containing protein n=1 Tax=Spirillospora sp. CA-294931 TaxID=3240042 RepID=UPI003D8F044A
MDLVKALVVAAVGLAIVWGGLNELLAWARMRRRMRRTIGVIVGSRTPGAVDPGIVGRSGVFQFTTERGEVVQATSSAYAGRGPKVGKRVPILYDPENPRRSAERAGVLKFKVYLSPVLMLAGLAVIAFGLAQLR